MIQFWLCSRPAPGMTRERFDYEWSVIHTSLMVTTPSVMRTFQRYIQHRCVRDELDPTNLVPHTTEWYNSSRHDLTDLSQLQEEIFGGEDYPRRMFGHNFGDASFVIELTSSEVRLDRPDQFSGRGGIKLLNFLKRRDDLSQNQFEQQWRGPYTDAFLEAVEASGNTVERYVQNYQLPLDASVFAGSLFEAGGVQTYAGIEELWFADLESLQRFQRDPAVVKTMAPALHEIADLDHSFSMTVVERVVWDQTLDGPRPAILDPDSFEAQLVAAERPNDAWAAAVSYAG